MKKCKCKLGKLILKLAAGLLAAVIVTLCTKAPSEEVGRLFDTAMSIDD